MSDSPENKDPKKDWGIIALILLVVLFFASAPEKLLEAFRTLDKKRVKKKELISLYQVDYKTFSKWIEYFCSDIWTIEDYSKRRSFTQEEVKLIYERLGNPIDLFTPPVMSKKEIAEKCESNTKILRENVLTFPDKYGISNEVYNSLDKFPPLVYEKILKLFQ